jgi:hypothetical protein
MQKNRKLQIEYILPTIIFASVIWGIFAGFRVSRYQWIMISGSVVLFLGICTLCDRLKQTVYLMIIMAGLFLAVFHTQLLNGFRIINNKMALALNQSMDLGFYYYVSVQMENSRRDSVLAVVFFLLIAGILLSFLRKYPLILFALTGVMECFVLIVAPYSISAVFFLFLESWIVYFSLRKGKKEFAGLIGILCILMIFPLYFHDQTTVPADTMIKRSILVQIRKMTQGESYVAEGGLGNGDIASVGEVSPTGKKLFQVYAPEKDDLYLKSYVSSDYVNGKWIASTKDTIVYGGESAIELPFLFSDLHMDDFVTYDKDYIKTDKDMMFSEKRNLKISYQKKQDRYLLFPYFCDISQIEGNVISDSMISRTNSRKDYDMVYYQVKNPKAVFQAQQRLDFSKIGSTMEEIMEKDYIKTMDDYGTYVRKEYLKIPDSIKKCLKTLDLKTDLKKSENQNIEEVQSYLKRNYQYSYRPGLTPQGKDPIVYFLKDRKKGFCTQYASAAVFMLRNAGIPARYVEGYKIRSDQWRLGKAQVTDYEAHAWAEVYVEHIGWLPVEVTGMNTGKTAYEQVQKLDKQSNAIVPNKKQFATNVKKVLHFVAIIAIILVVVILIKMLQNLQKLKKMDNKEKILYYENKLKKYGENQGKSRKTAELMTYGIIEKAKFSDGDITDQEVVIVKRHLDLLKRKNRNITKILSKLK